MGLQWKAEGHKVNLIEMTEGTAMMRVTEVTREMCARVTMIYEDGVSIAD